MSDLMNELIELAERLVELTTDQPTINDLKRMEEESKGEVCSECNYPSWWVDNGCNKCGYEVSNA